MSEQAREGARERSGSGDRGRLLWAFLWLRWRTLANSLGGRSRRTLDARIQAWVEMLIKVLLGLVLGVGAVGLAIGAVFAAPALEAGGKGRVVVLFVLRGGLGFLLVSLSFFSVFQAARGGGTRMTRLLLLPVSLRRLHGLELAASLADPWLLFAVPGLMLLTGLVAVLRPAGALAALLALVLFFALLATFATTLAFAVQLVFRNRRRAEWVALVAFILFMTLTFVPVLLDEHGGKRAREAPTEAPPAAETTAKQTEKESPEGGERQAAERSGDAGESGEAEEAAETFPIWLVPLPSEAFTLTLARASGPQPAVGSRAGAWIGVGILVLELLLLYRLSLVLWRRLLANPEASSGPRRTEAGSLPSLTLPGLSPVATVVAWAQLRAVWRTLQGRLALVMPTLTLVVLAFVFRPGGAVGSSKVGSAMGPATVAALLALGAVALALLGQQAILLNQHGIDDSGLSLTLLGPLSSQDLVLGKAVAGAVSTLVSLLPALLVVAVFHWRAPPLLWPAALLAAVATYALFAPVAAWVSVVLPKAVDLGQIGKKGQAHQGAAMVGMLSLGVVILPVAGMGLVALAVWKSPWLLLVSQAFLAVVCCLVAFPLLHLAGGLLDRRREALFLTVAERE